MDTIGIPYDRLLRRYRARAFVRNKVKLRSDSHPPRLTPELLRKQGAKALEDRKSSAKTSDRTEGFDDKRRISILEREVRMIRQEIVQLRMRR